MNVSQMKNIIVLKDLPSNLIDEAIVILKKGNKIKSKKMLENKEETEFERNSDASYEIALKEAEFLVQDYMKKIEKPNTSNMLTLNKINLRYKKLKICSLLLGITTILGIIICIIK